MKIKFILPRNESIPDGYYNSSKDLIDSFSAKGHDITLDIFDDCDFTLVYGEPTRASKIKSGERYGVYTMFESTLPPKFWEPYLQMAEFVAVPSQWMYDAFNKRYAGINLVKIPLAYNQEHFYNLERFKHRKFTFLSYNNGFGHARKGFFELISAFKKAFKPHHNVKLIVKSFADDEMQPNERFLWPSMKEDYDIEYIREKYTREQLRELLREADCFVFPSRGEGFGHTPLEAMATGIPAIVPNAHGISEYFNDTGCIGIKTHLARAYYDGMPNGDYGVQYKADVEDLAFKMVDTWYDAEEWADKSQEISDSVKQYSYDTTVDNLLFQIEAKI